MRDEAKTWWLVSGCDVASSYFFFKKIRVALESRDSHWYRQPLLTKWMFITQLFNHASSIMWAAIQKKKQTNKQTKHNACSHASSASNVHAFSTSYDGRNEKGQTCEGLSSTRPKNKQDKVLKDKKVIDKMKKGQNKKSKTVRGQKANRTMW